MTQARSSTLLGNQKRLWVKAIQLGQIRRQFKYVDYGQAQRDCEALAGQLLAAYSQEALREFSFVAIPRGGLIVLGLLAYILNLEPGQLSQSAPPPKAPLCIVDDCSLTGARFAQALAQWPNEHVVFAHLYSHPGLRKVLLEKEPRVRCCVAAQDLDAFKWDLRSDEGVGAAPPPSTLGSCHYWSGSVAPIAFAWSEPTMHVLDPFSHEVETAWRFAPPHLCLKNKVELGVPPNPATVQPWHCSAAVVMSQIDEVMWVVHTGTAKVYAFAGIEADMWRALVAYGSSDASLEYVESRQGIRDSSLRNRLETFVDYLAVEGLIESA